MEITLLSKDTIKIKGKQASLLVNPTKEIAKTTADMVLLMGVRSDIALSKVDEVRLVVRGAGDYEVGGVKVGASGVAEKVVYTIKIDNATIIVGTPDLLQKSKEGDTDIAIMYVNDAVTENVVTAIAPKMLVLYGEKSGDGLKALGKETLASVKKVQINPEKLPEEMEVVVLG